MLTGAGVIVGHVPRCFEVCGILDFGSGAGINVCQACETDLLNYAH